MTGPPAATTVAEALRAVGWTRSAPPRAPIVEGNGSVAVLLTSVDETGAPTPRGLLLGPHGWSLVGPSVARSTTSREAGLSEPTATLVDVVLACAISVDARFEELALSLDALEAKGDHPSAEELSALQLALLRAHGYLGRLERLLTELGGPAGGRFPQVGSVLTGLAASVGRTTENAAALLQAVRDLSVLRSAIEANRLARSANEIGRASNEIAALANTSNVRMLGVAYVALAIALVSVVVLIPNTAATILGMPSAAWVPGIDVDLVLIVLAIVPIAVVFSRPWVRRMLASSRAYEARSAEGMRGLPELAPEEAARPRDAERLIRERP